MTAVDRLPGAAHAIAGQALTTLAPMAAFNPLGATGYLRSAGAVAVFLVIFAETGLLIGFFLPGDSLLFTAGLFCTATVDGPRLSLATVLPAAVIGALAGAQVGWLIGRRAGPALLNTRRKSLSRGVTRAAGILNRYGVGKALVLARFIPVVRTVMNPLAGVDGVRFGTFLRWNLIGGVPWSAGVTLLGFVLGSRVGNIDHYLLPIAVGVVAVSLIPIAVELLRERHRGRS